MAIVVPGVQDLKRGIMSIIRENLMTMPGYSPYCGHDKCIGLMPRTKWDGEQFTCPACGWRSQFPEDFIAEYISKWHEAPNEELTGAEKRSPSQAPS